jgi:Holliday junction resolvasome RuvABC endonuclease subunit
VRRDRLFFKSDDALTVDGLLTMDPGIVGMGFAFWEQLERGKGIKARKPDVSGVIHGRRKEDWLTRVTDMCIWLHGFMVANDVQNVVMEFVQLWGQSSVSMASATKGDLFKLAFLVGALYQTASSLLVLDPVIVKPADWKGQMGKDVVDKRIWRAVKEAYPNHAADAVAIGLRIQGTL